jgi:hypothetical protein
LAGNGLTITLVLIATALRQDLQLRAAEAHEGENAMSGMEWLAFVIGSAVLVSIGVLAWKVTSH